MLLGDMMKLNSKFIQKYAETQILPPALEGEDTPIPPSGKVPEIAAIDPEKFTHHYFVYDRDQGSLQEYKKLKRRRELLQAYPDLSPEKIEELLAREQEQLFMTPEELGNAPTFLRASLDRLNSKYGAGGVMLPPPSEEVLNEEIAEEFPELQSEDELAQMSLKPPALPNISDLDLEGHNWLMFNPSDPNRAATQERARLEMEMAEKGRNADNSSTVPPGKKASADVMLKCCHAFQVLSRK